MMKPGQRCYDHKSCGIPLNGSMTRRQCDRGHCIPARAPVVCNPNNGQKVSPPSEREEPLPATLEIIRHGCSPHPDTASPRAGDSSETTLSGVYTSVW